MSTPLFLLASDHPAIQALLEGLAAQPNTAFSHRLQDVDEGALVAFDASGELAIQRAGSKEKPIVVDFVGGKAGHRRKFGGGKGQDIAKAVGLNKGVKPSVLDATGGLGRDSFVLASLGCNVTLIERSPVVAALLADGLRRALGDSVVAPIAQQMSLLPGNAIELMQASDNKYDVVYLDPMFPHREKSALVKKEMRLFQDLLGDDPDADQLLQPALDLARYRVVVKRPRLAPDLNGRAPTYRLEGKACRYDIYALKAFSG
ncbi:class I SAM-dependent methyltransferase [Endozoicomonas acroporae]|uniref:class I SAM-dependent methyltransferase n=1 Tax=Endozoicomonas acroporae TaxID=1701104 RepID=UPI00157FFCB4|nr:class I SAM-dependent methyltransferase [Endozoicomonas acroporae]